MADRRNFQRFDLDIPVLLTAVPNGCECPDKLLVTRDISAAGAFFDTLRPLAQGCELSFELQLPGRNRQRGRVQLKGTVVRSTSAGMAVSFDEECRFFAAGEVEGRIEN